MPSNKKNSRSWLLRILILALGFSLLSASRSVAGPDLDHELAVWDELSRQMDRVDGGLKRLEQIEREGEKRLYASLPRQSPLILANMDVFASEYAAVIKELVQLERAAYGSPPTGEPPPSLGIYR